MVLGAQFPSQGVLTGGKSAVKVQGHTVAMKTGQSLFKSPRATGEESKPFNDFTECLESFRDKRANNRLVFPMLGLVGLPFLRVPPIPHTTSP